MQGTLNPLLGRGAGSPGPGTGIDLGQQNLLFPCGPQEWIGRRGRSQGRLALFGRRKEEGGRRKQDKNEKK